MTPTPEEPQPEALDNPRPDALDERQPWITWLLVHALLVNGDDLPQVTQLLHDLDDLMFLSEPIPFRAALVMHSRMCFVHNLLVAGRAPPPSLPDLAWWVVKGELPTE